MIRIAIALATIVGFANVARGQVVRERIFGAPYAQFGSTVASIGDVDRDGVADYAVGEPNYSASSASHEGRVWIYSGASGTLLRVHVGSAGDTLGASVRGAGDVDGDGADDVLVGAPQHSSSNYFEEGLAVVFSGSTGFVIWSVHGSDDFQQVGVCVDSAGDLDGDGRPDSLVGSSADFAWVVDAHGAVLHDLRGGLLFGHAVAGIDDLDADLVPEFLVGEAWFDVSKTQPRRGRVWVYSGATATTLFSVDGAADHDYLGRTLSRLGDVDGDAIPDFIAASYVSSQGGNQAGLLRVLSGRDGSTLHQLVGGAASEWLGFAVAACSDLDGDGAPDYVVGIPGVPGTGSHGLGEARIHSGASGALIYDFLGTTFGAASNVALGFSVASDDFNGDRRPDFILGDPLFDDPAAGGPIGAAEVDLGCPASWQNYGAGWPGTLGVPTLTSQSDPGIGTTCALDFGNSRGVSTPGLLIVGFAAAAIALPSGATLLVDPALIVPVTVPAGGLVFAGSIPDDPTLGFTVLFLQGVEFDPGAVGKLALTAGLELRIGFDL
jgi:hypothetical protein